MANLTPAALDIALRAMFPPGSVVALLRGGEPIDDAGYVVQPLMAGSPQQAGDTGVRVVTNSEDIRFGPWTEEAPGEIDSWQVLSAEGEVLATGALTPTEQPRRGQELIIRARRIILGLR